MGYIGTKPSAVPLTSADITDGIITNADIASGAAIALTKLASTGTLTVDNIQFPATQVASANANTLDDYEEGTWTPTVIGSTLAGTATYSTQNARYTKIGNKVFIEFYVAWSSGTGTGNLLVSGLPFTSASISTFPALSIGYIENLTLPANSFALAYVNNADTKVEMWSYEINAANNSRISYDAAARFIIGGSYQV